MTWLIHFPFSRLSLVVTQCVIPRYFRSNHRLWFTASKYMEFITLKEKSEAEPWKLPSIYHNSTNVTSVDHWKAMLKQYQLTNACSAVSVVMHRCSAMGSCQLPEISLRVQHTPRTSCECLAFRQTWRSYTEPQWRRGELDKTSLKCMIK